MCRILVTGVAGPLEGDDAFGVTVARRLARRPQPPGVELVDFAVSEVDLAFAAADGYDAVVLVSDELSGGPFGTLAIAEARLEAGPRDPAPRLPGLDTRAVLDLVRQLGGGVPRLLLVAGGAGAPVAPTAEAVAALLRQLAAAEREATAARAPAWRDPDGPAARRSAERERAPA